eukprot:3912678-Pyramimonas_sp.AAC.1
MQVREKNARRVRRALRALRAPLGSSVLSPVASLREVEFETPFAPPLRPSSPSVQKGGRACPNHQPRKRRAERHARERSAAPSRNERLAPPEPILPPLLRLVLLRLRVGSGWCGGRAGGARPSMRRPRSKRAP